MVVEIIPKYNWVGFLLPPKKKLNNHVVVFVRCSVVNFGEVEYNLAMCHVPHHGKKHVVYNIIVIYIYIYSM